MILGKGWIKDTKDKVISHDMLHPNPKFYNTVEWQYYVNKDNNKF